MRASLIVLVLVVGFAIAGRAEAQTATVTATPSPTATATASQTPTPTPTATVTATITPRPDIACGTGTGAGGARADGICGGLCGLDSNGVAQVCRWDNSAANQGCICVDKVVDCDTGGVGQEMCTQGYCDRPPTMRGGQCTQQGRVCQCR